MSIPVVLGEQMQISASAISRSDFSEYITLRNGSGQWMGPDGAGGGAGTPDFPWTVDLIIWFQFEIC